jgi:MerR family transcriptional regulator, heat shock protein HspR
MAVNQDDELYFISMAARLLGMHPQTLRKYERLGLIQPTRTIGSVRVYSRDQLRRLRLIKHLVDEAGINLAGVQRLLSIAEALDRLGLLAGEESLGADEARHRLEEELERLREMVGFGRGLGF